jgi:exopolysaccharide biosynthesis polyprenyl glycosylphosphotransferase
MTSIANSKGTAILIIGDLIAYIFSLILTLTIRYEHIPGRDLLMVHLLPAFSILFIIFLVVNFSAGLYDKQSSFVRGRAQGLFLKTQIVNVILGIMFFYFIPVAIAPKTNLFIYFIISTAGLLLWRMVMFPVVSVTRKQNAILVGSGSDVQDLFDEVHDNARYGLSFKDHIEPQESVDKTAATIAESVKHTNATVIVVDLHNSKIESVMPFLYSLVFSGVQIIDASKLYEAVFDRIPLSMVRERWLVENSSVALGSRRVYDLMKRLMDIVVAGVVGIVSLLFYPFVFIAIKLDDGGSIFIKQQRMGKNNKPVNIIKFRSMTSNDSGTYGSNGKSQNRVTRVGKFIRLTRIDELPQLWNVIKGDQSLIGPRPELPALVGVYEKEIPYYNVRHLIKPGLSGWAQIYHRAHPHHAVAVEDTRDKLSYDLYYIKNRSLMLDLRIALQTINSIMSRQGV